MEQILSFLGFTSTVSILWNILGYAGMILIIIAVLSAKWRNRFFVLGPFFLLIYAWFFLHDPILSGLQLIIIASGVLNLLNVKKVTPAVMIILSAIIFTALLVTGQLSGLGYWIGALGLWGIALGFTQLPRRRAFTIMAIGGLLIIVYALIFKVWVFFILNIFFFGANLLEFRRYKEEAEN